jgi:hypothetical protein
MSFGNLSAIADNNNSLNGINVAENCAAGNINNAIRFLAACGKELYDIVDAIDVSTYMPVAGGAFTANITRSGAGGFLYHANSALANAPVYVQLSSADLPSSPAEGTIVFQYAA